MNALSMLTLVVLFLWAVGEAFSWPLVPDAALAVVVFVSPELAALSLAVVVLGTSLGGTVGVALWRRGRRWPLPMTTALMMTRLSQITGKFVRPP